MRRLLFIMRFGKDVAAPTEGRPALAGITGPQNVALTMCILFSGALNTKTFDAEEEALDWMVSRRGWRTDARRSGLLATEETVNMPGRLIFYPASI